MPCSQDDCPKDPRWKPVLELRSRSAARKLRFTQLGYCDEHKRTILLATFLSDEGFAKISRTLRESGKEKPDRHSTTLVWEPLTKSDLRKLTRTQHHTFAPLPDVEDTNSTC